MRSSRTHKSPALAERHVPLRLRDDGGIRLVVVADTHSAPHPDAERRIEAERPDAILHAGDIGDLSVLDRLGALAPVVAVRGNIDAGAPGVPDVAILSLEREGAPVMTLVMLHIAVYGPKIRADAAQLARRSGADLIVCGHSHVPFVARDKGLVVFNPGSIGPRRPPLPIVYGVLEIEAGAMKVRHMSCETGERWLP
ncbi:phosphodiesterase [Sorangium cellulosum]|uniref:Phosphoesterase n=1 Tax=Sorangium cellulosum TaxID=56 RepID=A0A2L0FB52_SORCE|nr:metallophosphoesterase family protein [Sorangium cellulosum]AUX48727.1 phosphodiesterase [Sorangium cellulosum]